MRKELLWAAGIGISFGLIIAFGAWRINRSIKKENISTQTSPNPSPSVSEFKITLDKPEDNDVVTTQTVAISGITKNSAWISVSGEKNDYILRAGDNGTFSQDAELVPGINRIKVTAFDPGGNQSIQKVLVIYSSSFQINTPVASPSPNDNSTESAIRQKVAEKVAEALNKPKAYIGVVTDIADSTIQIKTTDSQIKQISVSDPNVSVLNQKGTNNKTVKLGDIAIGDFIVAMGYISPKSVLLAQRILITDPVTDPKIDASFAKVIDDTSNTSITVSGIKDGQSSVVTPDRKTDMENYDAGKISLLKFVNIVDGDVVIYTTDSSGDAPVVRSIFRVQKGQPTPKPSPTP